MNQVRFRNLRIVEIEIFSHCSRACGWCPNSFIDRSKNTVLPRKFFVKILSELAAHGYKKYLSFSRYNEPMSRMAILLDRIELAREILPAAKIIFNTNGDYLTKSNLDKIHIQGLSVMDYDSLGLDACKKRFRECGVRISDVQYPYIYGTHKNIEEALYFVDWPKHAIMTCRANTLKHLKKENRRAPCGEPEHFLGIDYNGSIVPCCNFRSDFAGHGSYVLGNIRDNSISEILSLEKRRKLIATLAGTDWRRYPVECRYCLMPEVRYRKKNPTIRYR